MSRLLAIEVSPRSDHSTSSKLTAVFIEQWKAANRVEQKRELGSGG
jgi:FMN-dependent NADH-azoreductase